ncbi:PAS domain S-box-containing protein [Mucilaginibacter gossypiicola]|uniref:histidine kinase n=1 Tax=Mucilaginibacter gossypiicola TaxID=551995 RepID=A0A1H8UTQ2_9SPHI|nr:PAS domain S-box protein [Mucilaginibacter gossypiicola]SEP06600.1 PAS domain S-box-containing protein [Mucilaginibacter gossypiicola]
MGEKPLSANKPVLAPPTNFSELTGWDLLEDLPVAVYTCNKEGYITSYNKAAVKLWGKTPEANKDKWYVNWAMFNADGVPLASDETPTGRVLKYGKPVKQQEILIKRPDGSISYILSNPKPRFNEHGELTGAANTLIDITEQKNAESKQGMLASIIESSEDAIVSKNLNGIITSWNQAAQRLFGYTEDEIIGKHITILIPEDRYDEEELIISKIRANERIEHFETIRKTKSGEEIQISLTISPIRNKADKVIGASKIIRDIGRQKKSEEKLQQYAERLEILNSIGKVISAELDIQGILQKVTDSTTQLCGAQFGAFFHNQVNEQGESYMLFTLSGAPREAFEKFGMPRNTEVFHPTFSGEGTVRVDDITKDPRYGKNAPHFGKPKGHLPVVSYLAVPVRAKSGEVIGGLFFGHEQPGRFTNEHEQLVLAVAAQAAVALDNAKLYEDIKQLNEKKDEFIGLASHELKTPVTSLKGYLQIIARNLSPDDKNKVLANRALEQVGKLTTLISDLLDVTKIQTGKLPFTYASFDAIKLLNDLREILQQTGPSHQLILNLPAGELIVHADSQRIEQVIINLVTNAVKYSPKADKVIIEAVVTDNKLRVSVQDFGIGIQPDQQERVFSRFYRVENLASHMSGLGIGLYICQEIVNRHQGRLWVESIYGEGSTFYFEIPINTNDLYDA